MPAQPLEATHLLDELAYLQSNREIVELFLRDGERVGSVPPSLARALSERSAELLAGIEEIRKQLEGMRTGVDGHVAP